MNTFTLKFFSPDNYISFDEVVSILVNGVDGQSMVLANHAPYLIYMHSGNVVVKLRNEKEENIMINSGILKVSYNNCSIVTNTISR